MQQNLGALLVVVAIVVLGGWLIDRLTIYSRTLACIESGHRHCMLLDLKQSAPRELSVDAGSAEPQGK